MNARVIVIGKKRYLVGLSWRSFDHAQKIGALRETGKTMFPGEQGEPMGAQWYAMRPVSEEIVQAGFCRKPDGEKKPSGLIALAPLVASVQMQPWLGIYKVADGLWWYIAVRDGHTILPEGDAIGDEQFILALREKENWYGDWNYINGQIEDLENLISESEEKPSKVQPLNGTAIPTQYIAAGVGVAIAAGGALWWMGHQKAQEMERQRQQALARARAEMQHKKGIGSQGAKSIPSPLAIEPMPDEWLAACYLSSRAIPVSRDGWVLKSYECDAETNVVTVAWHREDGATATYRPEGAMSPDGDMVSASMPMSKPKQSDSRQNSGDRLDAEREALLAWSQSIGVKATLTSAAAPPTVSKSLPGQEKKGDGPRHGDAGPTSPTVRSIDFAFEIPFLPQGHDAPQGDRSQHALGLDNVAGARVSKLSFDGLKWKISGHLYEK